MEQSSGHQFQSGLFNSEPANNSQKAMSSAWGMPFGFNADDGSGDAGLFTNSLPSIPRGNFGSIKLENGFHYSNDVSCKLSRFSDDANRKESLTDPPIRGISSWSSNVKSFSNIESVKNIKKAGSSALGIPSSDVSLFSSSLPVLPREKWAYSELAHGVKPVGDAFYQLSKLNSNAEGKKSIDDLDLQDMENFLPDDDAALLAGLVDDFDLSELPTQVEELEECDVFGCGGGMELDLDPVESLNFGMAKTTISDSFVGSETNQYNHSNGVGSVAGEHPYGEHPSRTLFVRNINSNVEDSELESLFKQYGDIRKMYTQCKHRGFVMISYFDIRHARNAMRALQNKPLRRRKLDIHFSIPKNNPSDKDMNQGTLVVFNLDPSVPHDDIRQLFGAYGEVKEIRETPHKRHHKFIEFYDVRAAEAALRSLNRVDIAGKRIKLEPSRPGGARRSLMQQLSHELEQDETKSYRNQISPPIANSPPGTWAQFGSPNDNSPPRGLNSPSLGGISPVTSSNMTGLASLLPPVGSNSVKIAPIGKGQSTVSQADQSFSNNHLSRGVPFHHSQSFPEHSSVMMANVISSGSRLASFSPTTSSALSPGALTGPQFLWGSPTPYSENVKSSAWSTPNLGHSVTSNGQGQGFAYSGHHGSLVTPSHPVGSAPSVIPFERRYGFFPESPETSFATHAAFGSMGFGRSNGSLMMNMGARASVSPVVPLSGNVPEGSLNGFRTVPSSRMGHMFFGGPGYPGPGSKGVEGFSDRGWTRRVDTSSSQLESKKQYQLDLEKIVSGEDMRTTLMIKNIPNKYTSKMLLAAIDENHRGTYDFFYLPIDFKNKCNMGYAFINMVSAPLIISFYQAFNGKKWEKFNSEKVASLAYARIQGREALINHFQNSSLMNEDKRCRPILFHSEGPEAGDQEPFPTNGVNIQNGATSSGESQDSPAENTPNKNLELRGVSGSGPGEK